MAAPEQEMASIKHSLRALCVFCGQAGGRNPCYLTAAASLGQQLALTGITLVYGGGHTGMMGTLAETALRNGGHVIGIIPDCLTSMDALSLALTERVVVPSLEVRKRLMMERADAFCILPGGVGTMDEVFEVLTQKQLGLLPKPVLLVNVAGYFEAWHFLADTIIGEEFATDRIRRLYRMVDSVDQVLSTLAEELTIPAR